MLVTNTSDCAISNLDRDWETKEGLDALRQYRWAVTEKGETKNRPLHDWTSHAADSFRYVCIGLQETKNWTARIKYPKLGIV